MTKIHNTGEGTISLTIENKLTEASKKKTEDICRILDFYGINGPNAIKKDNNKYYVRNSEVKNGKHTVENLANLYKTVNSIEGLNIIYFIAETSSGFVKLTESGLKHAKYTHVLEDYKLIESCIEKEDSVEETREILYESISDEKKRAIDRFEEIKEKVEEEERNPNLYEFILEIYNNNIRQRTVAEKFLRKTLSDDFFKSAQVESRSHEIIFYNGRYKVSFPLSGGKSIAIIDSQLKRRPLEPIEADVEWSTKLIKLTTDYLLDSSFANLKELSEHYNPHSKDENVLQRLKSYRDTKLALNEDKLEEIVSDVYDEQLRAKEEKIEVLQHKIRLQESLEFAYSLESLRDWQECGWKINHYEGELKLTLDYEDSSRDL